MERRVDEIIRGSRELLAKALDRPPGSLAVDANLLAEGLDSLQVMEFLSDLGRTFDVACDASDFFARPTLQDFAGFLATRDRALASSPLVAIHPHGSRTPTFCVHPAGGQVAAYLPFHALLGDDHPLYAIQSRACGTPEREHRSIAAMAIDYATLVQGARPIGPYRLLGWSLGGFVAHAVALELERRGEHVELIGVIDSLPAASVASVARDAAGDAVLYARHIELLRSHAPGLVDAPIDAFWAGTRATAGDSWARWTTGGIRNTIVGGTHLTIVLPPYVETIMRMWQEANASPLSAGA
jgi:thioesterase domain-containing protein/aryl carrier-like protein